MPPRFPRELCVWRGKRDRNREITCHLCKDLARHFQDQPICDRVKGRIAPVEVEDEFMDAHNDILAEEARNVAVEMMPMDAHMRRKVIAYVARLHDTLHQKQPERLARMPQRSAAHPHVVQAAREYKCGACRAVERPDPRPRAADVCNVLGEVVGWDGFAWQHPNTFKRFTCV